MLESVSIHGRQRSEGTRHKEEKKKKEKRGGEEEEKELREEGQNQNKIVSCSRFLFINALESFLYCFIRTNSQL